MPATPPISSDSIALRRLQASLEQPAAVFMELCTGDALAGDRAVAEAMRNQSVAADVALHALTVRFWRVLLAAPDIRTGPLPALPAPLSTLARLPAGLRVLVLLKVLSGLGEVEIAALLARSPTACRRALARAEALVGEVDWQAWPPALAMRVQAVSPARRVNIASWRSVSAASPRGRVASRQVIPPGRRRALAGVAVGTAIALAATYVWPGGRSMDDTPRIRSRALAEEVPASRYDAQMAIATHPERALFEIAEEDAAIARETAFYAWYQAEQLGTSTYEPPSPAFQAPESVVSSTDTGGQDAP